MQQRHALPQDPVFLSVLNREPWIALLNCAIQIEPNLMLISVTIFFRNSTAVTPQLLDWFQSLGMEASPHATAACLATLRDSDLREDIPSVKVPTVLFHGLHDQICPFELAETMTAPTEVMPTARWQWRPGRSNLGEPAAGGIRGAKLIRFENSGHALFYEERDKFNTELINFIEKKSSREKLFFPL